jgi:hypothetical protein
VIVEWDNDWDLISPFGTLGLNKLVPYKSGELGYYLLDPARCQAGAARRITRDNIAQADGEITHRKFKTGYAIELNIQLWETLTQPACGGVLRQMADLLDLHLNAIENTDGRLVWTPTDWPQGGASPPGRRILDKARSLGPSGSGAGGGFVAVVTEKDTESPLTSVTFAVLSPLPYVMDLTQTTTQLYPTGAVIYNDGNANMWPVIKIHGPCTKVTIQNLDALDENGNVLQLVYDSTLPGAVAIASGHYAELDFFRNTIYLDGTGANLKAGINVLQTDFWPIVPGPNAINIPPPIGGATTNIEMLWNNAYV